MVKKKRKEREREKEEEKNKEKIKYDLKYLKEKEILKKIGLKIKL